MSGAASCRFTSPAIGIAEGEDGRYSIFPKSPVASPVVVEIGFFEVQ